MALFLGALACPSFTCDDRGYKISVGTASLRPGEVFSLPSLSHDGGGLNRLIDRPKGYKFSWGFSKALGRNDP